MEREERNQICRLSGYFRTATTSRSHLLYHLYEVATSDLPWFDDQLLSVLGKGQHGFLALPAHPLKTESCFRPVRFMSSFL